MQRPALRYRRIVAKLGTSLLTGGRDRLDLEVMAALVGQIARLRAMEAEVLVVSSGAIAAGRHKLGLARESRHVGIATMQVLAAVGQSQLMQAYDQLFDWHGLTVAQALLTRADLASKRAAGNARRTLEGLLALGVVPIINENDVVATEEIGGTFGDNDNLSAAVANLVGADLLVLLTDQEGLYDDDPRRNPAATLLPYVGRVTEEVLQAAQATGSGAGRGGMASKVQAAQEVTSWGTAAVIASGRSPEALVRIATGERVGTFFEPWGVRRTAERRRSLGRAFVTGALVVDAGAAAALRRGKSSLLAVGVQAVRGTFQAGEVVEVLDPDLTPIARGTAEYSSDVVERIKGMRSAQVRALLSEGDSNSFAGEEVVHLDNLALL